MIPDGWTEMPLRAVIKLASGESRPKDIRERPSGEHTSPVYGGNGVLGYSSVHNSVADDIIIGRVGEYCGITRFVGGPKWVTDNALFAKSVVHNVSREFLALRLQHFDVSKLRSKGGQPLVSQEPIYAQCFTFPPIFEQKSIVSIISTWDRAIETVEALIANARAQKKALMQSLLTGKMRLPGFSGAWRQVAISEIASEVSERGLAHADYPVLSCSKHDGMVKSLSYFKKKVYSDDTSNYKVMRRGTFGFPSNHVEEGSIGHQDICDVGIVSPIYCVFRANDKIEDGFLYKLLKTDRYRQIFAAATNASVDRRGSLRWKEFAKIKVPLPPLDEQAAINKLIDAADQCEQGYSIQLTALRQEKSALMQQLLTGKRRVQLEVETA